MTKAIINMGKGEVILKVGEHTMKVDIKNLMKYPSRASKELGAIELSDDHDIKACIEEVMMFNEEANFEELPLLLLLLLNYFCLLKESRHLLLLLIKLKEQLIEVF